MRFGTDPSDPPHRLTQSLIFVTPLAYLLPPPFPSLVNQDGDYRYICQAANDCHYSMNGAGGGCCGGGDGVSIGRAGFGLLTFNEHGGMFLEQITTGTECEMWPVNLPPDSCPTSARTPARTCALT
jgi:hypothetical protein